MTAQMYVDLMIARVVDPILDLLVDRPLRFIAHWILSRGF